MCWWWDVSAVGGRGRGRGRGTLDVGRGRGERFLHVSRKRRVQEQEALEVQVRQVQCRCVARAGTSKVPEGETQRRLPGRQREQYRAGTVQSTYPYLPYYLTRYGYCLPCLPSIVTKN